jgi:hypothetical protein
MQQHTRKMRETRLKNAGISAKPKLFQQPDLISTDFLLTSEISLLNQDYSNEKEAFICKNNQVAGYYRQYALEKRRI